MFAFDEAPAYTALLLQCGYRSKICTNHRATKTDGTLHKLCEFHRRKANLNQLKLHKRQREERAKAAKKQPPKAANNRSTKKSRVDSNVVVEPIHHSPSEFGGSSESESTNLQPCESDLAPEDIHMLKLLLFDAPPQQTSSPCTTSPSAVDDLNAIVL